MMPTIIQSASVLDASTEEAHIAHSSDFLRLARLWQHSTHFSLLFAAFDNPAYRDELIQRLNAVQPGLRIELTANDTPQDWLARLQAATYVGEKRVHTLLPARDPEDTAQWWQQANVLRECLADAFPAMLLLWLPDSAIDIAAHHAPDLWNWRETVVTFTQPSTRFAPLQDAEAQQLRQRLQDIQRYLQQGDADPLSAAHLNLEAATALQRLGQWADSEAAARAAAHSFLHAGNTRMAALAESQMADILRARAAL
jgi:hypothetical protein